MDGIQVGVNVNILFEIGTFDSPTENLQMIYMYRAKKMTNQAIDGNSGHFESEIEWTELESSEDKPRFDHFHFLVGLGAIVLASGTELEDVHNKVRGPDPVKTEIWSTMSDFNAKIVDRNRSAPGTLLYRSRSALFSLRNKI